MPTQDELRAEFEKARPEADADLAAEFERATPIEAPQRRGARAETALSQKLGEGMAPGFNRISAAIGATLSPVVPRHDPTQGWGLHPRGASWGERYANELRALQGQSAATQAERPYASAALQVAGAVPTAMATGGGGAGAGVVGQGSRLLRALQAARQGAGFGAAYAAGDVPADAGIGTIAAHTAGGAVLGGGLGGAAGALLPSHVPNQAMVRAGASGPTRRAFGRAVESTVTPTPEAEFLRSKGVPLTVGQLNPRSAAGQIEEASTSLRSVGASIQAQREAARRGWQAVTMNEARPPGMAPLEGKAPLPDEMARLYGGFRPAYDAAVKGQRVLPGIRGPGGEMMPLASVEKGPPGAFDMAALDPRVMADAATRKKVAGFLRNQLTILPKESGPVDVEALVKVRSNIRDAGRQAVQAQDFAADRLLANAEAATTRAITTQLPKENAAALRAADRQYRLYKVLEDAMVRAKDSPSGFSPSQLAMAIRSATDKGEFARGGGGPLRQLSRAGNVVFESTSRPTGQRLLTVGPLGEWGTGPAAMYANMTPRGAPRVRPPGGPGVGALAPAAGEALPAGAGLAIDDMLTPQDAEWMLVEQLRRRR